MGINVLSLFDGMSCGRIALERAGVEVDRYYSSEVDADSIFIANKNYQQDEKFRLGDVRNITSDDINDDIYLLIGGSPCQSFSFAGKQNGMTTKCNKEIVSLEEYLKLKEEGFEFEGQSYLFWEYIRLFRMVKPKYFLLENVNMPKKWQNVISEVLDVEPIRINSKLVSGQLRDRLYWTNIPNIKMPNDKNIKFNEIITNGVTDKEKSYCLTLHGGNARDYFKKSQSNIVYEPNPMGRYIIKDCKIEINFPRSKDPNKIHIFTVNLPDGRYDIRSINAEECEMLQTVPIGYTDGVSVTKRRNMLGNGWTVDVIAHIFKNINQ